MGRKIENDFFGTKTEIDGKKLKNDILLIIDDFLKYNLNTQSVINSISRKFSNGK